MNEWMNQSAHHVCQLRRCVPKSDKEMKLKHYSAGLKQEWWMRLLLPTNMLTSWALFRLTGVVFSFTSHSLPLTPHPSLLHLLSPYLLGPHPLIFPPVTLSSPHPHPLISSPLTPLSHHSLISLPLTTYLLTPQPLICSLNDHPSLSYLLTLHPLLTPHPSSPHHSPLTPSSPHSLISSTLTPISPHPSLPYLLASHPSSPRSSSPYLLAPQPLSLLLTCCLFQVCSEVIQDLSDYM